MSDIRECACVTTDFGSIVRYDRRDERSTI
jgi:hypothetical protein